MKNRTVLVVDDDQFVLQSCRKILESEGCRVTCVSSAREALTGLGQGSFDCMIMDIKMPHEDGFHLLKKIREALPSGQAPAPVPVLVMTGYLTQETLKELKKSEVRHFIPKPFTPDELVAAVDKVLKE